MQLQEAPKPPEILPPPFVLDVWAAFDRTDLTAKEFAEQLGLYVHGFLRGVQPTDFFPKARHSPFFAHLINYQTAVCIMFSIIAYLC